MTEPDDDGDRRRTYNLEIAVAANVPNPGKDEAVVTDANILAADTPE